MSRVQRGMVSAIALMALTGCPLPDEKEPDTADTAGDTETCPGSLEEFCVYEFGGACPTYEQAAAMTCVGHHFDPTGSTGEPPTTTDGDYECEYPIVSCHDPEDSNIETVIFFDNTGSGEIAWIHVSWTDDEECGWMSYVGEPVC